MSTLSLRKIKHDSSAVDNIVTNSDGGVGIGGIDPSTLPAFIDHAIKVQNGGGLGIQSANATDNRWIFFGNGTTSGDVQRAGIVNQGSDQSLALATAGSQKLIVSASGIITKPYQPSFCAHAAGGTGYSGSTTIVFPTIKHNTGSHYNNSTGRFTAPVAGRYLFYAQMLGDSSGNRTIAYIAMNGTTDASGQNIEISAYTGTYNSAQGTVIMDLVAGDYVSIKTSTSTNAWYNGSSFQNFFCGYLIG